MGGGSRLVRTAAGSEETDRPVWLNGPTLRRRWSPNSREAPLLTAAAISRVERRTDGTLPAISVLDDSGSFIGTLDLSEMEKQQ